MFRRLADGVNWWVDGVAEAASAIRDRLQGRHGGIVARADGEGGWNLYDDDGAVGAIARVVPGESAPSTASLRPLLRGRRVVVELASHQVFRAELPPVPAESQDFLAAIVDHRVDRIAPWRRDDRIVGFTTQPSADGQIAITVAVTARAFVDSLLAVTENAGAREVSVVSVPSVPSDPVMSMSPAAAGGHRQDAWLPTAAALVMLVAGTAVLGAILAVKTVHLDQELPELQQRIDDRLLVLRKAQAAMRPAADGGDAIAVQKSEAPVSVVLLEVLSRLLPDDTSLTSLTLAEGHLKISGATRSISALIPTLTASPYFSDAEFTDPTERLEDGSDRFSLQMALRPKSSLNAPG